MKTVTIKNSWLSESDLRLDASYHLSDGVNTKRIIDNKCPYPTVALREEADKLYKGNIHKRVYVTSPEHGHMFYTASDMFRSDIDSGKYVSKKYSPHLDDLELKKDWILITRSGTLGKVVYVTDDYVGKIGTDDLVRIKPSEKQIKRGYLYAFLSSKYGYGLITQSGYGGVVKHIEPHHIEHIKIPIFPEPKQLEIHNLIMDTANLRVEANKLLAETHDIFKKFINKNCFNETSVKCSNIRDKGRLNAFFFLSQGQGFEKQILKKDHYLIKDITTEIFTSGREKRDYVNDIINGKYFFSNTDLASNNPYKSSSIIRKSKAKKESEIKENYLLTGRVGSVGEVSYPFKHLLNHLASDNVIRMSFADIDKMKFAYGFLTSNIGRKMIFKRKSGTNQPFITEEMLKDIPIPNLNNEEEKKIVSNISKHIQKIEKALENENQAINLIENEIESWQTS